MSGGACSVVSGICTEMISRKSVVLLERQAGGCQTAEAKTMASVILCRRCQHPRAERRTKWQLRVQTGD